MKGRCPVIHHGERSRDPKDSKIERGKSTVHEFSCKMLLDFNILSACVLNWLTRRQTNFLLAPIVKDAAASKILRCLNGQKDIWTYSRKIILVQSVLFKFVNFDLFLTSENHRFSCVRFLSFIFQTFSERDDENSVMIRGSKGLPRC